jgi:hypothetical protein
MKKNQYDFIILYRKQEIVLIIKVFRKIGWSSIPSKSVKVFDAGLHGQKTLTKI